MLLAGQTDVAMSVEWSGSLTGDVETRVEGSLTDAGDAEHASRTITNGGESGHDEFVRLDGRTYERHTDGPWIETTNDARYDFLELFDGREVETGGEPGTPPWRFAFLPADVAPRLLELDLREAEAVITTRSFEVLVDVQGRPIRADMVADIVISTADGDRDAVAEYEWTFSDFGESLDVVAPSDVWAIYESDSAGYAIGRPSDWAFQASSSGDEFIGPGYYMVVRISRPEPSPELSAETVARVAQLAAEFEVDPDAMKQSQTTLLGEAADLIEFATVLNGDAVRIVHAESVLPYAQISIFLLELDGTSASTRRTLDTVLTTIAIQR